MQSVHQFMQQAQMQSARERLGIQPMHFIPKVQVDEVFIQDNLQFGQRPSSYHELPKFASTKIQSQSSETRNYYEVSRRIFENIFPNINQNLTIYPLKTKNGSITSLLIFLIWIAYAIGTSQSNLEMNMFNLIDFTGMFIAFAITFYEIVISKKSIQFDHFLHTLGIVITIVLVIYSTAPGDPFPFVLRIIRSFRLLFIMNINFSFEDLCQMYFHKTLRILKVLQPWIFITLLFSVIMYQGTYYQFYNRCSTIIQNSILPNVSQSALCGSNNCEGDSICTNPMSYDQIPDGSLYNNGSSLAFGYFQYDNLLHSYFTVISSAFLANSSKIITIFRNSSPIIIIAIVNLLLIIATKLFGSSILLVLLEQYFCEKLSRFKLTGQLLASKVRVSNISGNSFAAPTFGPSSANSIDLKFKKNSKDQSFQLSKNEEQMMDQNTLEPPKSIQFSNTKQFKSNNDIPEDQKQSCYNKTIQIITIVFVMLVGSAHFGLSIIFSFGNLNEMDNRLIGVCLVVIFIVWTVWIFLKMSGITEEDEDKKNQEVEENYKVIFSIEIAIYFIHFADYLTRIFIGGYILEQPSPLTPLATALLLVRIIYIPIAFESILFSSDGWKKLIISIKVYQDLVSNIMVFFLFVIICSLILATFTQQINGLSFFYQTWKYCKTIFNLNWLEHYNNSNINSSIDASNGWGVVIKTALIMIGELIILNMIFADAIINAFHTYMNIKDINATKVAEEALNNQAIKQVIRNEKTFYLIPYDFLCIRSTIDSLLQTQNYKGAKQKIITTYMIALPIGYCILKDFMGYEYFILIGDSFLLLDACLTIIAHRFWGEGSLVNKKWYNLINFLISVIIIVNLVMPLFNVFFLRTFRIFLLISIWPELGEAYQRICSCLGSMRKIFKLILFFWAIITLMVAIMMAKVSNSDILSMIVESFNFSLHLMEKGFDLPSALSFNLGSEIQFYTIYSTIIYLFIRIPLQCMLIGVGISHFQSLNFQKQEDQMIQLAIQSQFDNNGLSAEQQYELHSIKNNILTYYPEYNPLNGLPSNFIKDLLDQHKNVLTAVNIILILIDAFLLIFIPLITHYITEQQLLQVKLMRFSFYFLGLLLFILDSIVYRACNDQFYVKLIIYIISFPGSLLMMVPIHKVQASVQLANLLQFLLMLAPLTILQVYYIVQFKISRIVRYITTRFRYTLWISLWMLSATLFFTGIMLLIIINQSFFYLFTMVFIGMCGSTYEIALESNQKYSIIALYFVQICIFFTGLVLRSTIIASFIYQCVQKIRDFQRSKGQNKEILRSDFNKIFNQQIFNHLWNKLDTKAIGMLPFRTVLNNLYKFSKCFNLHQIYIQYILKPKHEAFDLKLQLFRRLHLPIRVVSITQRADDSRTSEYMITLHDVIARFYCLALDDNIHKIQLIKGAEEIKQSNHTYRNWSSKLGFDGNQWAKSVSQKLNTVNYKRWVEQQQKQKYFAPKEIQIHSWSMGSVLRIFPALRTRLSSVKLKTK